MTLVTLNDLDSLKEMNIYIFHSIIVIIIIIIISLEMCSVGKHSSFCCCFVTKDIIHHNSDRNIL